MRVASSNAEKRRNLTFLSSFARSSNLLPLGDLEGGEGGKPTDAFIVEVALIYTGKKSMYWLNDAFQFVLDKHRKAMDKDGYDVGMTSQYLMLR